MARVAIYTRVSTVDQAIDGFSLEAQLKTLTVYCHEHNYEAVAHYSDEGISGKDIKHRPAMLKLLDDAKKHHFDIILVWKLTRFSRSLSDLISICDMLERNGIALVSYSEYFDCTTPAGRLMRNMLGVIAQWEREVVSENVRAAMEERAMQGKPTCSYVLGYDRQDSGDFTVNANEAHIVRDIFERYLLLQSFTGVSRYCAQRGYHGKRGGSLLPESIHKILTRYIYAGFYSWKGSPIKGEIQPIVPISLFNNIQDIILSKGANTGRKRRNTIKHL